jgi:hypothetical protein
MDESQSKLVFRAVLLTMLLMVGLALFAAGFGELQARAAGTRPGSPIPPLLAVLAGGASLGLAALVARRLWLRYALGRHGFRVAGTITGAVATDDLAWTVSYQFRDRQGELRSGRFVSSLDAWQSGDVGEVAYLDDGGGSAWLTTTPPREPNAPAPRRGAVKRFFGWFAGLVALTSGAAAAAALYLVWAPIWKAEGFIGTLGVIGAWKVIGSWVLISLVASIFASIVVAMVGGAVLTAFTVVRHALRD